MLNDLETVRAITGASHTSTTRHNADHKVDRLRTRAGRLTARSRGGLVGSALRCLDIHWREWVSERHTRRIRLRNRQS